MGNRKVSVKQSAADSIAEIAWFIEAKGMVKTAENFSEAVYDFIENLSKAIKSYSNCKELKRAKLGYKCVPFRKFTVVFIETTAEIIICEFIPSKMIHW